MCLSDAYLHTHGHNLSSEQLERPRDHDDSLSEKNNWIPVVRVSLRSSERSLLTLEHCAELCGAHWHSDVRRALVVRHTYIHTYMRASGLCVCVCVCSE